MTLVGRFFSFTRLSLFNLWFCCCEYLEEIDLGLSSSGLREEREDPVEDPRTCLDNPDIGNGFLLSFILILSISRFKEVFLEACNTVLEASEN